MIPFFPTLFCCCFSVCRAKNVLAGFEVISFKLAEFGFNLKNLIKPTVSTERKCVKFAPALRYDPQFFIGPNKDLLRLK